MKPIVLVPLLACALGCAQKMHYRTLEPLGSFSPKLEEVSGIAPASPGTYWVIEDSGNEDEIHLVDSTAHSIKSLKIDNAKNRDWEELAKDGLGNLYIGDFGNNDNKRKDLTIYKVPASELDKKEPRAEKIKFHYPQQTAFPPKKDSLYFDTEGFFHRGDQLYIFTKNRTRPYSGKTLIYSVPDREGEYTARFLGSLYLCGDKDQCSVTAADISPDGSTIALLGYGLLFIVRDFELSDFSGATIQSYNFRSRTQTESVSFVDESTLLIADEQNKHGGGKLYRYKID